MTAAPVFPASREGLREDDLRIPPPPPSHPLRPARVLRLLKSLNESAEQTADALAVFDAVGGDGGERIFQRFAADPRGRQLLVEKPHLQSVTGDREWLAALPDGSFGRAYLEFALANGFAADGLVAIGREVEREGQGELDPHRQWFWDRFSMAHDLWHVLTGCDTSEDGEAILLSFSHAQTPQRGFACLLGLILVRTHVKLHFHRKLWTARRAGLRAAPLLFARFEELLARPLADVRRELNVPVLEQ